MSQILEVEVGVVEVGEVVVVVARDLILYHRTGLDSCQPFPLRKGASVWLELN